MKELRILSGSKKGDSLPVDHSVLRIGSAVNNELILDHPGINKEHISVSLHSNNEIFIDVIEGHITDHNGSNLKKSFVSNINLPFLIGETWIVVQSVEDLWPSRLPVVKNKNNNLSFFRKKLRVFLFAISTFIIFYLFGSNIFAEDKNSTSEIKNNGDYRLDSENFKNNYAIPIDENKVDKFVSVHSVKNILDKMLLEREINNVDVIENDDNITLTGTLKRKDKKSLERMLIRYHRDYGEITRVLNETKQYNLKLPFEINSVVSGPFGHITTNDGEKIFVGQKKQGYILEEISDRKISFSGKQSIEVNW